MQAHLQRPSFIVCAVSHMDCAVSPNRLRGSFQTEHSLLAMVPVIPVIYYGTAVPADCSICLISPRKMELLSVSFRTSLRQRLIICDNERYAAQAEHVHSCALLHDLSAVRAITRRPTSYTRTAT